MPIYEYRCRACGAEFEELVFSQDELPPCPKCGSTQVEKLMSACAVQTDGGATGLGPMPTAGSGGCSPGG
ncbi:zinc ribbon domain-containing protein [Pseudodesulfovibrio cashew]|uniref:Zinc ribbon domain-containing protein n=1 Tax=Pseudodesulfovibrio cashew TaxID=2678688 RepID=A0A6I6JD95_9BACT|nr:zinc ribbon domain-containing protein [Pseudodesulfovibrio cashew]QGY40091.1 zinc ribbon domain-containing protein [Pseudodesulfovibrio cashew]